MSAEVQGGTAAVDRIAAPVQPRSALPSARVDWIDRSRGLGIVIVVIGHVTLSKELHDWIFLFHMPLFFALSGMVAKERSLAALARSRWNALAVPYLAFLVVIGAADLLLAPFSGTKAFLTSEAPAHVALRLFWSGDKLVTVYGVFWFVPCLFATSLVFNELLVRVRQRWLIALVVVGLAAASLFVPGQRNPWGLGSVPMAMLFYWLGWLGVFGHKGGRLPWIAAVVAAVALAMSYGHIGLFDMKYRMFGTIPANEAAAVLGIFLVVAVARWGLAWQPLAILSSFLGQASLTIMFLHQLIHYHLVGHCGEWVIVLLAVAVPACLGKLFDLHPLPRRLLNGKG